MKVLTRILSLLIIASATIFFANCGSKGGGEDPAEKVELGKLSKTWTMISATLQGPPDGNKTSEFTGFKLTISGTFNSSSPKGPYTYNVSGTQQNPAPWPSSGTWQFGSTVPGQIIRDKGNADLETPMTYTISSDNKLTVEFTLADTWTGGRVNQVSGAWKFIFQ